MDREMYLFSSEFIVVVVVWMPPMMMTKVLMLVMMVLLPAAMMSSMAMTPSLHLVLEFGHGPHKSYPDGEC